MLRIDQYDSALRDMNRQRHGARSDEARVAWGWAWTQMLEARSHAVLVSRFDEESASLRAIAARLSNRPEGRGEAERTRIRSSELHDIAERHRQAADACQAEAEATLPDCRALSERDTEEHAQQQREQAQREGSQNGQRQRGRPQSEQQPHLERPQQHEQHEQRTE